MGEGGEGGSIGKLLAVAVAVATSIDALAVGVSFAFLELNVWVAVLVIRLTTFALSSSAVLLGHRVGNRYQRPAEGAA